MNGSARLLDDPPLSGPTNMARDAALLTCRQAPTLRFYRWERPTVSLGWFQSADDLPLDLLEREGCAVVRRETGGRAILHDRELTYSLCLPERLLSAPTGQPTGNITDWTSVLHGALAAELTRQSGASVAWRGDRRPLSDRTGSPWCFEDSAPQDLILGGRKLLGSAARRRGGWILFHGSLVLDAPTATPEIGALGREPDCDALASAIGGAFDFEFDPGDWSEKELRLAAELERDRFGSSNFTLRR